jgi:hypothetical protein
MSVFTMTVWIVAIVCVTTLLDKYLKARGKALQERIEAPSVTEEELAALRERVAVLERIIVDRRFDLAEQIDQLERDHRI